MPLIEAKIISLIPFIEFTKTFSKESIALLIASNLLPKASILASIADSLEFKELTTDKTLSNLLDIDVADEIDKLVFDCAVIFLTPSPQ